MYVLKANGHCLLYFITSSFICQDSGFTFTSSPSIEHGLTSAPTQYRLYGRRFFTGQKTQPAVSKYWRRKLQRKTTQKDTKYTYAYTQNSIQIKDTQINTASLLIYN